MKYRSKTSGYSLAEVTVSAALGTMTIFAAVSVFLMNSASWARGEGRIDSETNVRQAVRIVSDELREAMNVTVDNDGQGLTYRKPKKDGNGDFEIPVTWDGIDRRIELSGTNLVLTEGANTSRIIARNVMTQDPFMDGDHAISSSISSVASSNDWTDYQIFVPNTGAVTTEVMVKLVIGTTGGQAGEYVRARKREIVALRNVPELIN